MKSSASDGAGASPWISTLAGDLVEGRQEHAVIRWAGTGKPGKAFPPRCATDRPPGPACASARPPAVRLLCDFSGQGASPAANAASRPAGASPPAPRTRATAAPGKCRPRAGPGGAPAPCARRADVPSASQPGERSPVRRPPRAAATPARRRFPRPRVSTGMPRARVRSTSRASGGPLVQPQHGKIRRHAFEFRAEQHGGQFGGEFLGRRSAADGLREAEFPVFTDAQHVAARRPVEQRGRSPPPGPWWPPPRRRTSCGRGSSRARSTAGRARTDCRADTVSTATTTSVSVRASSWMRHAHAFHRVGQDFLQLDLGHLAQLSRLGGRQREALDEAHFQGQGEHDAAPPRRGWPPAPPAWGTPGACPVPLDAAARSRTVLSAAERAEEFPLAGLRRGQDHGGGQPGAGWPARARACVGGGGGSSILFPLQYLGLAGVLARDDFNGPLHIDGLPNADNAHGRIVQT